MINKLTLKELAFECNSKMLQAVALVDSVIPGYEKDYIVTKGVQCISVFRGEYDYSFIIPWEYCEDEEKIKDFYIRLEEFTKDAGTIPEKDELCSKFTDLEFKKLKENKS